jgi:phage major head subunit gpT-like protein
MPQDFFTRLAVNSLNSSILDPVNRVVQLTFSSDAPYLRRTWFDGDYYETLGHESTEANFQRLNGGAPLLKNHDNGIGIVEKAWIENNKGTAIVRLSKNQPELEAFWKDIEDGIIRNVSVGYRVYEKTLTKKGDNSPNEYRVTNWEAFEISILDIPPADASVGIGRADEQFFKRNGVNIMSDNHGKYPDKKQEEIPKTIEQPIDVEAIRRQAFEEGQKALLERNAKIDAIFRNHEQHHGDLKKRCLEDSKLELDQVRQLLLEEIGKRSGAVFIDGISPLRGDSKAEADNFAEGVVKGFLSRSGMEKPDFTNQWQGRSILEIAERSILLRGENVESYEKRRIISQALQSRAGAMSSSDLPRLFNTAIQKVLSNSFSNAQAEEIYSNLVKPISLANFLTYDLVSYGSTGSWKEHDQHGERSPTYVSESGEKIKLKTFYNQLRFTREMMINDQLSLLFDFVDDLGSGANRKIGDEFINFITGNPILSDGNPLFHSSHKNVASSGGKVNVTTLSDAVLAMAMHKGPGDNGSVLNLAPTILLVPKSDQINTEQFVNNQFDPNATNVNTKNPFANKFTVYADARFDTYDTPKTNWYALANPKQKGGIVFGTLDGKNSPTLESQVGLQLDGILYEGFIDFKFGVNTHRPLYMNPGV